MEWLKRSLTPGGFLAAVVLAIVVVVCQGAEWLIPLLVFFLSSTLIGKFFPAAPNQAADAKDHQPRDVVQVVCNGLVYGIVAAFFPFADLFLLVCISVANADTWASELGQYFRQPTFDILRWRRVPPGLSGGISVAGTLGGAAGAMAIAGLGFLLLPSYGFLPFLIISGFGFGGMLLDSILGSLLQVKYGNHAYTEFSDTPRPGFQHVSGFRWITNDVVNLLAILLTTLGALLGLTMALAQTPFPR